MKQSEFDRYREQLSGIVADISMAENKQVATKTTLRCMDAIAHNAIEPVRDCTISFVWTPVRSQLLEDFHSATQNNAVLEVFNGL